MRESKTIIKESESEELSEIEARALLLELRRLALNEILPFSNLSWLSQAVNQTQHIEGLISLMRFVDGGQLTMLKKLEQLKPNLSWYRGGTLTTLREYLPTTEGFSEKQLNTFIIDKGRNGTLGRPSVAQNFLNLYPREKPVLYRLTLAAIINGLTEDAIILVSERDYDLCVTCRNEYIQRVRYATFCRDNLRLIKDVIRSKSAVAHNVLEGLKKLMLE